MDDPTTPMALETAVGMMDAAVKMHAKLEKRMQRALLSETVVYEQEFKYPRMTTVESRFWILFYTGSTGFFMLIFIMALLVCYMYLKPGADIGSVPYLILIIIFLSMIIVFITSCYSVPKEKEHVEREWMKVMLTDKFLVIVKTNIPGLKLTEIYNKKRERGRIVLTITIEKIICLKPHFSNWIIKRFRHRDELIMLRIIRMGEVINFKWDDTLFLPIPTLTSFLTILHRLGPHIKIDNKLDVVR